uniref:RNA exonuclease 4 n=1 Tax=Steinernema glaseri TaxID=37863 RepID=A0A1I7YFG7_9BILA
MSENWRKLQNELATASNVGKALHRTKATTQKKKKADARNFPNKWKQQKERIIEAKKHVNQEAVRTVDAIDTLKKGKKFLLGLDCEYVGAGPDGKIDILARVSIVDEEGNCVYDKYVAPTQEVTDYRTDVSGVRASDLVKGIPFDNVRSEVSDIIQGNIVVGHALHNDFRVLQLNHPKSKIRDTSKYRLIQKKCNVPGRSPSLKAIAQMLLGLSIQSGEHSSVEDAKVAMAAYRMFKNPWEQMVRQKYRE